MAIITSKRAQAISLLVSWKLKSIGLVIKQNSIGGVFLNPLSLGGIFFYMILAYLTLVTECFSPPKISEIGSKQMDTFSIKSI